MAALRWAAAIGCVIAATLSAPTHAHAALVAPEGSAVASSSARVLVSWDGTTETIELGLGLGVGGAGERLGLILPAPASPEVSLGDVALFEALDAVAAPRTVTETDWWGRATPEPTREAVDPMPLRDVEETTIRASQTRALSRWLKQNGFSLDAETRSLLADYAEDGWSLTLASFSTEKDGASLQPLRFTFPASEPVFPLRLWGTSASPVSMRFYVVGDGRTELHEDNRSERAINAAQSVAWSGRLEGTALESLGTYLTVTDVRIDKPGEQITDDILIERAVADDEIIPVSTLYRPVELLGLPLGWLLVVWGGAGLVLGLGYLALRLRAR